MQNDGPALPYHPLARRGLVFIIFLLGIALLVSTLPPARGVEILQQTVHFGVPRTSVVEGLDFEATCQVGISYPAVSVLDGGNVAAFLGAAPGPCEIVVYVLGVSLSLPLQDSAPLGRQSFEIPGVSGLTLGLANVNIDLVTGLAATLSNPESSITASPASLTWNQWDSAGLTITANVGRAGSTITMAAPYAFSIEFSLGLSVSSFGITLFSVDLASLGSFPGAPTVQIPVSIDLIPRAVEITHASAVDSTTLHIEWNASPDSDFAGYQIQVEDSSGRLVYLVDSREATSITIPASPGRAYTISLTVVDRSAQSSSPSSATIQTPLPSTETEFISNPNDASVAAALGFTAGVGISVVAWFIARRRG